MATPTTTSSSNIRRLIPNTISNPSTPSHVRHHSISTSTATSTQPIPAPTINVKSPPDDVGFDVPAGAHYAMYIGELDWARSDLHRFMRMGYLRDVDFELDPNQAFRRTRERGRGITRPGRNELTTAFTTITTATTTPSFFRPKSSSRGRRAGEIPTSTLVQGGETIEGFSKSSSCHRLEGGDNLEKHSPYPKTFWEAELAAQREIDDDDYAWYYRNPHRHTWRPRCLSTAMRLRVYSRRRMIMRGDVEAEEGMPTKVNRMLFAEYVGRHYREMRLGGFETDAYEENHKELAKFGEETIPEKNQVGIQLFTTGDALANIHDDAISPSIEDWQEELFSPKYSHRRFRRASCASSVETYTSSNHSSSSAPSSARRSCEMDADSPGLWITDNSRGGSGGSCKKSCYISSSRVRGAGFQQVSFLRVTAT